jgi:hypothetical protein
MTPKKEKKPTDSRQWTKREEQLNVKGDQYYHLSRMAKEQAKNAPNPNGNLAKSLKYEAEAFEAKSVAANNEHRASFWRRQTPEDLKKADREKAREYEKKVKKERADLMNRKRHTNRVGGSPLVSAVPGVFSFIKVRYMADITTMFYLLITGAISFWVTMWHIGVWVGDRLRNWAERGRKQ